MITGATKVIGPVPGCKLNPFLLAQSQTHEAYGLILIDYEEEPPVFDILFLKGQHIWPAARMGPKSRFMIDPGFIQDKFSALRSNPGTVVFLFDVPKESMDRFFATLVAEPYLKLELTPLSRRQRLSLLEKSVRPGTLCEIDRFSRVPPSIILAELNSPEDIRPLRPLPDEGLLFLYDVGANIALIKEKERYGIVPGQRSVSRDASAEGTEKRRVVDPAQEEMFPSNSVQPEQGGNGEPQTKPETRNPEPTPGATRLNDEDAELVHVMAEFVKRFKHEVRSNLGNLRDRVLDRGEEEMRNLFRAFDSTRLTIDTAAFALEYVRITAMHAPFFKRSQVKWIAEEAISQLYSKQYDVLEYHGLIERTETIYHRLKKKRIPLFSMW
jgi:hypothetical protein